MWYIRRCQEKNAENAESMRVFTQEIANSAKICKQNVKWLDNVVYMV